MGMNTKDNVMQNEELYSSQFMYYGISKDYSNWVEFQMELVRDVDKELLESVVNEVMRKRYPYFLQKLAKDSEKFYLVGNDKDIKIYDLTQRQFLFGPKNDEFLFRVAVSDNRLSFFFFHGLADGRGFMPFVRTALLEYFNREEKTTYIVQNINQIDSKIKESEYTDQYLFGVSESEAALNFKPDTIEVPFQIPEEFDSQGRRFQHKLVVNSEDFMKFTKSEDGSPNVIIALFMANAILAVHPEASDKIVPGIAFDFRPALASQDSHLSSIGLIKIHHKKRFESMPFTTQATSYRGRIFLESDESTMKECIKKTIGGCQYVQSLPTLEAKREMCQQIISGQMHTYTFTVSYAGKSALGDIEKNIKSFYTNVDMKITKMMIEINCTQDKFFFNIMQGFESDCYVKKVIEEFEKEAIACQYDGVKAINDVAADGDIVL